MSIFASQVTATLPIPFEPGSMVTVQKLNGRQLGKAQEAFMLELTRGIQERGGAKAQKELMDLWKSDTPATANADAKAAVEAVKANPLNGFDPYTLIKRGVVSVDGAKLTDEQVEDLSDEAVEFFATEVLRLTKPSLFRSAAEVEAAQVKG